MATQIAAMPQQQPLRSIKTHCKQFFHTWKTLLSSPSHHSKPRISSFHPSNLPSKPSDSSGYSSKSRSKDREEVVEITPASPTMRPHEDVEGEEEIMKGDKKHDIPHVDLLTWLFGNDNYDHNKPIYIDALNPGKSISTNEAKSIVRSMIGGLRSLGVMPGDAVCIHSFNDLSSELGGNSSGSTVLELAHHLRISETRFIIAQPRLMDVIQEAAAQVGISEENIISFNADNEKAPEDGPFRSYFVLKMHKEEDWIHFDDEFTAKNTVMGLFSSSGTTGLPKVIAISHYAWVAGSILLEDVLSRPYEVKRLMCLPTFHGFAAPLTVGVPIRMGQTTYILPRFEMKQFCQVVEDNEITDTAVVPPCLQAFVKSSLEKPDQLRSLRRIWCGAAPLNVKIQNEVIKLFADDAEIVNIWGMTEIGITVGMKYEEADRTGAASKLLANTEAKIINDKGENVTFTKEKGEIFIRTPQVSLGYFRNEEASKETFLPSGWVRTGDIAYFSDGKLYIVDRKKELIKVRGWQVAPAELEGVLMSHPDIRDAAVIGVKTGKGDDDEAPRAYVVRQEGSAITEEQIKEFILTKLSKYKALDGGVIFVESIPRSPAGKILKKIIRSEWLHPSEVIAPGDALKG
ncbi:S-dihydroxybenzoyltransferase [Dactylella cylindrospora]|nr:S-dihydroxybenzoyltransferase [Dactylella cylindrospora]